MTCPFNYQSLNPPVLVFVQNKERAKELYDELKFDDIRASVIHSDLNQIQVIFGISFSCQNQSFISLTLILFIQ